MATETAVEKVLRAGRADAAVLLVAKRVNPAMDLDDWGRALDLKHQDLVTAVDRFKQRTGGRAVLPVLNARRSRCHTERPRRSLMHQCPFCDKSVQQGKRWAAHMASFHNEEWQAQLSERLSTSCPDCGVAIKVTVTVEAHECQHAGLVRDRHA